jgi:hypothetical protein
MAVQGQLQQQAAVVVLVVLAVLVRELLAARAVTV